MFDRACGQKSLKCSSATIESPAALKRDEFCAPKHVGEVLGIEMLQLGNGLESYNIEQHTLFLDIGNAYYCDAKCINVI